MEKYSYPTVEDYIEIIAGDKDVTGTYITLFDNYEAPISLARYDVKVITSFSNQIVAHIGFTDRQAPLAYNLVLKYERQLAKLGVDISPLRNGPVYRFALRTINRNTRAWIEDDTIKIQFPYQIELIESIREVQKNSRGYIKFNRDKKIWEADLTEYNLNWFYIFAKTNNFEIDTNLESMMELLLAVEKTDYKIELAATKTGLNITNSEDSLLEYINTNLGGVNDTNLLKLVDYSPILGYTVDKTIEQVVIDAYGPRFYSLCVNRELQASIDEKIIIEIINYAKDTSRFPIFIYEPDLSNRLTKLFLQHFLTNETHNLDTDKNIPDEVKLVYLTKVSKDVSTRIPVLVSSAGMMFGGDKHMWLQQAEKIVYFTQDVYNKKTKGTTICKLD